MERIVEFCLLYSSHLQYRKEQEIGVVKNEEN